MRGVWKGQKLRIQNVIVRHFPTCRRLRGLLKIDDGTAALGFDGVDALPGLDLVAVVLVVEKTLFLIRRLENFR